MSDLDHQERTATLHRLAQESSGQFKTAEERAAHVIRAAIVSGVLEPGTHLAQNRLADLLNVSRMPIRAALNQLESEGLVVSRAHSGATVRALQAQEISDLYELRILIETFALKRTVALIDEEQLAELEALASTLESDEQRWPEGRDRFYSALYSIGNSPRVVRTLMQFQAEIGRYTPSLADLKSRSHLDLLRIIRLRDPDLASAWLEAHLREVARTMRDESSDPSRA